jgi:hypothetical protein
MMRNYMKNRNESGSKVKGNPIQMAGKPAAPLNLADWQI